MPLWRNKGGNANNLDHSYSLASARWSEKKLHENFRVKKKTSFLGVMKIRPIKKEVTTLIEKTSRGPQLVVPILFRKIKMKKMVETTRKLYCC